MAVEVTWLAQNLVEREFIESLLEPLFLAETSALLSVVVYSGFERQPSSELVELAYQKSENRRVLFHLSDELLRHRTSIYSRFDLVIRNYFDPRLSWRKNVVCFPLGTATGYGSLGKTKDSPLEYLWSFVGAPKRDRRRRSMVEEFKVLQPGFLHFSSGWKSSDQLQPERVHEIQERTAFALCPSGNTHIDTFRVMEALEAGAIPVSKRFLGRDFYRYTFGDHPMVVANSWKAAVSAVTAVGTNPELFESTRANVHAWYLGYCEMLFRDFQKLITGDESVRDNRQYRIQRLARFDVALLVRVWRKFVKNLR